LAGLSKGSSYHAVKKCEGVKMSTTAIQCKTFRYKYSPEFAEHLEYFAKLHQYDDRHAFKEAWGKWIITTEISKQIQKEAQHFKEQEQKGDILDKMFKSARYYYRKKESTNPEEKQTQRRQYIGVSPDFIREIDTYIQRQMKLYCEHLTYKLEKCMITISPAESFDAFCKEYSKQIESEMDHLYLMKFSQADAEYKIKHTYKNRFYLQTKSIQTKSIPKETMV